MGAAESFDRSLRGHYKSLPGPGAYYSNEPSRKSVEQLRATLKANVDKAERFQQALVAGSSPMAEAAEEDGFAVTTAD